MKNKNDNERISNSFSASLKCFAMLGVSAKEVEINLMEFLERWNKLLRKEKPDK